MGRSEGMSFITAIVIVSLLAGSVPGQKEIPTACYQDARQISRGPRELVQLSTPSFLREITESDFKRFAYQENFSKPNCSNLGKPTENTKGLPKGSPMSQFHR